MQKDMDLMVFIIFVGIRVPLFLQRERYEFVGVRGLWGFAIILIFIILLCCCGYRKHLTREPVGCFNPVKQIFKVLNYARHHSQPVFRSAFTYGEVPSRLDLYS